MDSGKETEPQVVLVSGGSRGLGQSLVEDLLSRGYTVATFSRTQTPFILQCLERHANDNRFYWEAIDAMDVAGVQAFARAVRPNTVAMFAETVANPRCEVLDLPAVAAVARAAGVVLINNAAIVVENILTMMQGEDIDNQLAINLESPIYLTQSCLKSMLQRKQGCIINISSVNGLRGNAGISVYSATKGAIDGFTRSLAREMGPAGIRVNSVAPGFFASDGARDLLTAAQISRIVRRTPLGRLGDMQDMLGMIRFLMSKEASFITGQTIAIDGGLSC